MKNWMGFTLSFRSLKFLTIQYDEAEKFTSEMHDPCARSRCLQERTTQKHLQKAPVWSRPNTLRRLSQIVAIRSIVIVIAVETAILVSGSLGWIAL